MAAEGFSAPLTQSMKTLYEKLANDKKKKGAKK